VIFFKVFLSLGIELASFMTRLDANFVSPVVSTGATGLPTEPQRYGCNMQRKQTLAGAKGLGPCVAHSCCQSLSAFATGLTPKRAQDLKAFLAASPHS
jgi:hypothetical protein